MWIDVKFTRILTKPIYRTELLNHPVLGDLMVLRAPQGTIFPVSPEEWSALQKLINKKK